MDQDQVGRARPGTGFDTDRSFALRRQMVDTQLRTYDVTDLVVLDAVEKVPREAFLPAEARPFAYLDRPHRVGPAGRHLLTPMVVSRMIQSLAIMPGERCLEIAGGTGYGAAVMAAISGAATLLEADEDTAALARNALAAAGFPTVAVHAGAIDQPAPVLSARFDAILVQGAVDAVPPALLDALADGGRLVAIVGAGRAGRVTLHVKNGASVGQRAVFDAAAPVIEAFAARPGFVF